MGIESSSARQELEVELPATLVAPSISRQNLDDLPSLVDGPLLDDLKLLVSELVSNAVRHTPHEPGDTVKLIVRVDDRKVSAEVCDHGSGFEQGAARPAGEESGWGLYLLDRLSDRWGTSSNDHWCVWFELEHP